MYTRHSCAVPFQRLERQTWEAQRGSAMNAKEHAASTKTAANTQAFMERDMSEQVEWLVQRARARGYADLVELFGKAPAVYTQLAETWRQAHPLPEMAWA